MWCSKSAKVEKKIESYLTASEINEENNLLLGASELGGSFWSGSLWIFEKPDDAPDLSKSLVGLGVDTGVADAKFLPGGKKLLYADHCGGLTLVELLKPSDDCPMSYSIGNEYRAHNDFVTALDVINIDSFVSSSVDGSAILWDTGTAFATRTCDHASSVMSISKKPDENKVFATVCRDSMFVLWDCREELPASGFKLSSIPLSSLDWVDDNIAVAGDASGYLTMLDVRNMKESTKKWRFSSSGGIRRVRVNRRLSLISCAVDEFGVKVFSVSKQNDITLIFSSHVHEDVVSSLAWEPNGNRLWSFGWDTKVFSYKIDAAAAENLPPLPCESTSSLTQEPRPDWLQRYYATLLDHNCIKRGEMVSLTLDSRVFLTIIALAMSPLHAMHFDIKFSTD